MAKSTKQTRTIDGLVCELRPTKCGTTPIGSVPVPVCRTQADLVKLVEKNILDWPSIAKHFMSGFAIALQRMARTAVEGEKFSDSAFTREWNKLSADELKQYAGRADVLRSELKSRWEKNQEDLAADKNHVWEELL